MSVPIVYGPDSGGRLKGVCIVKPIVYGNMAVPLKSRRDDNHTHRWILYLKPYENEDMSGFIKQVNFKLHESFSNPSRTVKIPPYEITETGWGEFEVTIKIFFHDPNERPITLYHILRLHSAPNVKDIQLECGNGIVSEHYNEIIFQDPSQLLHYFLTKQNVLTVGTYEHHTNFEEIKEETLEKLQEAKTKLKEELKEYARKLKLASDTVEDFKEEVAKSQNAPNLN